MPLVRPTARAGEHSAATSLTCYHRDETPVRSAVFIKVGQQRGKNAQGPTIDGASDISNQLSEKPSHICHWKKY